MIYSQNGHLVNDFKPKVHNTQRAAVLNAHFIRKLNTTRRTNHAVE